MSSKGAALVDEIMALEPVERRAVAEELLLRLQDSEDDAEILQLARERWEDLEARPDSWISHEELVASLHR